LFDSTLARHSLGWRSPYECHWGDTPDISVFRFPFWSEVWYYSPSNQFPQSKMLPGQFLGIAQNVGDAFCYLVLTEPMDASTAPQVIARSVISQCSSASVPSPPTEVQESFSFYCRDGKTLLSDPSPSPDQSPDTLDDVVDSSGLCLLADTVSQAIVEAFHQDPLHSAIASFDGPPTKWAHLDLPVDPSPSSQDSPSAQVDTIAEELPPLSDTHLMSNTVEDSAQFASNQSADVPVVCADVPLPASLLDSDGDDHLNETSAVHVATVTQEDEDTASLDPGSVSFSDSETSPEVNSEVSRHLETLCDDADDDLFHLIVGHEWKNGILMMTLKWKTDEMTEVPFTLAKRDYPYEVSKYFR